MATDKKTGGKKKAAKKSVKLGDNVELKVKVKKTKKGKDGGSKANKPEGKGALEALAKLAESPLVTELIAAGATAAVAAIAGSKKQGGGKAAAKAAASAIGTRLMSEFNAMRQDNKSGGKA